MNLLAIIFPLAAVIGGFVALAYMNKSGTKNKGAAQASVPRNSKVSKYKTPEEMTAQEFVNVRDITDKYL
jgi:hypothetical protein